MFAIIDCNNFYASCERVFNPALEQQPVVILSSNDGCVIARSEEAKTLGIPMGAPLFEIEKLVKQFGVNVFSSNYTLYGDMSHRVMTVIASFVPEMEIYSIDEAFIDLSTLKEHFDLETLCRTIRKAVLKNTGIPVSIGIAPTKTLAKVANKMAKANKNSKGVFALEEDIDIQLVLQKYKVGDVWGIGGRYEKLLQNQGIYTAFDFTLALPNWVQKKMTVQGLRIWHELRGKSCIPLERIPPSKQNICTSRSFGKMQTNFQPIEEAVSTYAARCGAKLRRQHTCAKVMIVFLHTNYFRKDLPQYSKSIVVNLPVATNSSLELVKYASYALQKIYKDGYQYKKAGVIVAEIMPENQVIAALFDEVDRPKHRKLMLALDQLNHQFGREKVKVGKQGFGIKWKNKEHFLSRCYTTRLDDIIGVF